MVVLKHIKPNIMIQLRCKDKPTNTLSILTKISQKKVFDRLFNTISDYGSNKVRLMVTVDGKSISKVMMISSSFEEAVQKIIKYIDNTKTMLRYVKCNYTFAIFNNYTRIHDSKRVSFYDKRGFDFIYGELEKAMKAVIQKEKSKNIKFIDIEKKRSSHLWSLTENGRSRGSSIKLEGYSSEELMGLVIEEMR